MISKILLSAFLVIGLMSCEAQKKTTEKTKLPTKNSAPAKGSKLKVYTLQEGETKFFEDAQMNITFSGISEDSRCPEGVDCVWQGAGVADITLMGTYTRPYKTKISTASIAGKDYKNTVEFNGYNITLQYLSPKKAGKNASEKSVLKFTVANQNYPEPVPATRK